MITEVAANDFLGSCHLVAIMVHLQKFRISSLISSQLVRFNASLSVTYTQTLKHFALNITSICHLVIFLWQFQEVCGQLLSLPHLSELAYIDGSVHKGSKTVYFRF